MEISDADLHRQATECTAKARETAATRKGWQYMGCVGAALVTEGGNVFTGINVDLMCGIGFCAEHSAVAEMVRNGESRISRIVATTADGTIIPPCGRCRELLYQIDEGNLDAAVLVEEGTRCSLRDLLPRNWQPCFPWSLYKAS